MSSLLIIGAGGHGKVVADAALMSGWTNVSFLDDREEVQGSLLGLPVLGAIGELESHAGAFDAAVVAIGDAKLRLNLLQRCRAASLDVASVSHPSACVSRFATVAAGCVLLAQCAVNAGARLGVGCIVNTGATIDHDCALDGGVHVCPGAHLAGSVRVGQNTWIGIGAVVRQRIMIGRDVLVGAGAVVVADVADGATVIGNPAKERVSST